MVGGQSTLPPNHRFFGTNRIKKQILLCIHIRNMVHYASVGSFYCRGIAIHPSVIVASNGGLDILLIIKNDKLILTAVAENVVVSG